MTTAASSCRRVKTTSRYQFQASSRLVGESASLRFTIRSDNRAAEEWELEQGGKYFSVGVSSATTGKGAHLFLIDDPIKDRKDADSPAPAPIPRPRGCRTGW
jgi:hypothetical protein